MSKGFFVDDLITIRKDVDEACCLFAKARERMSEEAANFESGRLMINHLHIVSQ